MDYTTWSQMQQNGPPNPNSTTDPYAQNPHPTLNYYFPQPQNPNPNPNPNHSIDPAKPHEAHYVSTLVQPPGTDPYQPVAAYTLSHGYTYQTADGTSVVVSSAYGQDVSLVVANAAVAADQFAVSHYATSVVLPPNVIESLVPGSSDSKLWTYPTNNRKSGNWKKGPKKTKVVQSVWCEICNVECNAKDVLEQHKLGKKHMKNLEKRTGVSASGPRAASAPTSAPAASGSSATSTTSKNPIIGPQENPNKTKSTSGQKAKKKPGDPPENLETKRRKVLEGGAAADAVRTCALCNVVCNSETVFRYHLAGQKHAAMVKKLASGTVAAAAAI